jgi:hypothetical protein
VRQNHAVEYLDRIDAKSYLGQRLELGKGDRLTRTGATQAPRGVLIGARDAIKYRHDVAGVRIGFLESCRQQRSRESAFLHVGTFSKPCQPGSVLRI